MALTDKKRKFIKGLKMGLNQTEAAVFAGYSEKTAEQQGSRLMKDKDIVKGLEGVKHYVKPEIEEEITVTPEDLKELCRKYDDPMTKLMDVLNSGDPELSFEAAKILMPYYHGKVTEAGKKETKQQKAKSQSQSSKYGSLKARLKVVK